MVLTWWRMLIKYHKNPVNCSVKNFIYISIYALDIYIIVGKTGFHHLRMTLTTETELFFDYLKDWDYTCVVLLNNNL